MNNDQDLQLGHGAIPSKPDDRDWTLASAGAPSTFPSSCFIDQTMMNVSMQSKIGCCVGCTFEEIVRLIRINQGYSQEDLSFRFVYALAKCQDGYAGEGTSPALVAKIIRKYGVPLAKYCPNDVSLPHEDFVYNRDISRIPPEAFTDALSRRSGADFAVPVSIEGIKQAINYAKDNKGGVAICRQIGDSYWKAKNGVSSWKKEDIVPIRLPDNYTGGHEEMLYGYDEEPETGRVRIYWLNHWSKDWADNGRAWEYADIWIKNVTEIRVVVPEVPVVVDFTYNFTKNLKRGDKGADVVALQHVLKLEGVYPVGTPFTGFFWDKTTIGVKALQEKYASEILVPAGITTGIGTGIFGNSTRAFINKKYNK